jgi:DNA-binding SARP family transcriptional activator
MRYRLLGDLSVVGPDGVLLSAAPRVRVVLATLLLDADQVLHLDRLVDAVWGETPPSTARGQIQICVSALRRSLVAAGIDDAIVTRQSGYLLRVPDGELDLREFDGLVSGGRAARAQGRLADAAGRYRQALALWRGTPFDGMNSRLLLAAAASLSEQHLALREEHLDVQLRLGNHHDLIGELKRLVGEHPVREGLWAQLMTALYRDGRQAEALAVYRQARQIFVAELGLEPGPQLRRLEHAILNGDTQLDEPAWASATAPAPEPAAARPRVRLPRLLPADTGDLVLDDPAVIGQLRHMLGGAAAATATAVPTVVVSGAGGTGKTTLAVHAAHRCVADFPDGQLYITLHGLDPHPVSAGPALQRFLRALGVPDWAIPDGVEERAEMYRDRLAGRRVLVVLDDAGHEDQIIPLLPGGATSAVLVTSRRRLTRLPDAHQVEVDVFEPLRALALLARVAGADRVGAEPIAARALVRLCGGLPLALRIAAARLAARPHWSLADLVARLVDERYRLDELSHGGLDVRQTIATAYEGMADVSRRLFRRLSLVEGGDFDGGVCRPLLGVGSREAQDALAGLVDAYLVNVVRTDGRSARFRFHELVRLYARERLAAEEPPQRRLAASDRVGAWYRQERRSLVVAVPQVAGSALAAARGDGAVAWPAGEG